MERGNVLHLELQSPQASKGSEGREGQSETHTGTPENGLRVVKPEKLMRLLTERNLALLKMIREEKPTSLAQLASMSGRPKASLSRTIQRMMALGIVKLVASGGRGKSPVVVCDRLRLDVPLDG